MKPLQAPLFPQTARSKTRRIPRPEDIVWWLFLIWTAIGFVVMPLGIDAMTIRRHFDDGIIRRVVLAILPVSDAIWIAFAAVVVYFHTAAAEGLKTARRWSALILIGAATAEWIGARTGIPFGPYRYTDGFGWRIAGVLPVAIPLAWLVILLCGRTLILRLRPGAGRLELSLGTALVAVLTDFNLEWIAWKVRGYWIWYPDQVGTVPTWPPPQNFVAWFALSFLLIVVLPPSYELRLRQPSPIRPIAVLGLMNALFLAVYAIYWLGKLRHHTIA